MSNTFLYISMVMGGIFIMFAFLVAIEPPAMFVEPPYMRYVVGFILFFYVIFRLSRGYQKLKEQKRDL